MSEDLRTKRSFVLAQGDQEHVIVRVQNMEWRVLSRLICDKSQVFRNAFENTIKEDKERRTELDEDPALVIRMIIWLYHDCYPYPFMEETFDHAGATMPSLHDMFIWGREATHAPAFTSEELAAIQAVEEDDTDETKTAKLFVFADEYELCDLNTQLRHDLLEEADSNSFPIFKKFFEQHGLGNDECVKSLLRDIALKYLHYLFKDDEIQAWMQADGMIASRIAMKLIEDNVVLEARITSLEARMPTSKVKKRVKVSADD